MESEYTTLIERYFDQRLLPLEHELVQDLLANNAEFKSEFELFEKANKAIELQALSDLKEQIRGMDKNQKSNTFGMLKIAANILLIAFVSSFFYAQTQLSTSKIFDSSYESAPDYITDMGSNQDDLSKAMQLYNKKDYTAAIKAFTPLAKRSEEATFYLGQCYLETDNTNLAIESFSKIGGKYKPEAQWYLALAYLKAGNENATYITLDSIIESNEDEAFVLKAKSLNKKLNNPLRILIF